MSYAIFILFAAISLLGLAFLAFKKISSLLALPVQPEAALSGHNSFFKKITSKFNELRYAKFRISFSSWSVRILQKLKVQILKVDNLSTKLMQKMKERAHTFNIRSKAWMIKKHIEDVQEKSQIETLIEEKKNGDKQLLMEESAPQPIAPADEPSRENVSAADKEQELIAQITQEPKNIALYSELADFYIERKNFQDAKLAIKQILKLKPGNQEAQEKLDEIIDEQ